MNMIYPVAAIMLLGFGFVLALLQGSLKDFSRSLLSEYCQRTGRPDRFGQILKRAEDAYVLISSLAIINTIALAAVLWLAWLDWLLLPPHESWPLFILQTIGALLLVLVCNVVLPWTITRIYGEWTLFIAWPVISKLLIVTRPALMLVHATDTLLFRLFGVSRQEDEADVITEEIRTVVDEGQREGILESEARSMIHRVIQLQDADAADIMTPRTDMISLPRETSLEEARMRLLEAGHSRVPVIGESTDDILGILYAKDLLKHLHDANGQDVELKDIVREPFYVPETKSIDSLLQAMRQQHLHFAIVLDEYGGVAGLVTMEDILEEIVGEIEDEYDEEEAKMITQIEPGVHEVDARVHIDDVNEQFDLQIPDDGDYDTIGGFAMTQLGRVPEQGERFTWVQYHIEIREADKRQIHKLRLIKDDSLIPAHTEEN